MSLGHVSVAVHPGFQFSVPAVGPNVSVELIPDGGPFHSLIILMNSVLLDVTFLEVGLLGKRLCTFSRYCQTALHGSCGFTVLPAKRESVFPILANSESCETFDLCQSAGWKMASGCTFHLTSLMLSEVEHLFSTQPYG